MTEERTLTDADIKALATEFREQFYSNLGKGIWSLVWKALVGLAVYLAYLGATNGWFK